MPQFREMDSISQVDYPPWWLPPIYINKETLKCKSMPLVRRGLTPLILLVVRHSK